jgi:hypothetical protein
MAKKAKKAKKKTGTRGSKPKRAAPKAKTARKRATTKAKPEPSLGRVATFSPTAKGTLVLPVALSDRTPIRPESVRPRTWVERVLPER